MALFKVTDIINGNTIEVEGWVWKEFEGTKVVIQGYEVKEEKFAQSILKTLILGKEVELKKVVKVDKGDEIKGDIVYCSVFLNEVDIANYQKLTTT